MKYLFKIKWMQSDAKKKEFYFKRSNIFFLVKMDFYSNILCCLKYFTSISALIVSENAATNIILSEFGQFVMPYLRLRRKNVWKTILIETARNQILTSVAIRAAFL